jgi:hypothetical protein
MDVSLHLIYEIQGKPQISAARIKDKKLLVEAARRAIEEAERKAEEMAKIDELLGKLQAEEAERLGKVLTLLIPEVSLP